MWSEPKVVSIKSVDSVPNDVLKVAYEYLTEFEQFRTQYNNAVFKNTSASDDIPLEL